MIYLKTSVGIEMRGDDMLISSLQSNFSGGVFTHFKRIAGYEQVLEKYSNYDVTLIKNHLGRMNTGSYQAAEPGPA